MDLLKIADLGKELGCTGKALKQYIENEEKKAAEREKQCIEREERARDRQEKAKEDEHKRELERKEKESELLRQQKEHEHRRELERRDKDLEIMKLQMTMGKDTKEGVTINVHKPKLPKFEEEKDDMDTYLQRFEKVAKTQKWKQEEWVMNLSPLLTGKGLEVYMCMPDDDMDDYGQLKLALLKRYQMTEDGFRKAFKEGKSD